MSDSEGLCLESGNIQEGRYLTLARVPVATNVRMYIDLLSTNDPQLSLVE